MKRFKFGKIEITMSPINLRKVRSIFETEIDEKAMGLLMVAFNEEKLPFNQINVEKVLSRIVIK